MSPTIDPSSVLIIENVERFAVLASRVPCTLLSAGTRFALISAPTFRPKSGEFKKEGGTNTNKEKNTYIAPETKPLLAFRMTEHAPDDRTLSGAVRRSNGDTRTLFGKQARHTSLHLSIILSIKLENFHTLLLKVIF